MKGYRTGTSIPSDFTSDLQEAHQVEEFIKDWIAKELNCSVETTQELGSFSGYDLKATFPDGQEITVEVKMDRKVQWSGNVAVEFQRTHKDGTIRPTCISATKADWWVYYFNKAYHFIKTVKLKELIQQKKYSRIVNGAGDGDRASIFLFPVEVFKQESIIVKP